MPNSHAQQANFGGEVDALFPGEQPGKRLIMKLKFLTPYVESDAGFKQDHEYDFVDMKRANYFVDHGLAVPIETVIERLADKKTKRGNVNANTDSHHESK